MNRLAETAAQAPAVTAAPRRFLRLSPHEHAWLFQTGLDRRLADPTLCVRIRQELADRGRLYRCASGYEWVGHLSAEVCEAVLALVDG